MTLEFVVASYLLGSIPFGLLLTRQWVGKDVRAHGSGNIGATNVARVAGVKIALLVLALDALKGAVPVLVAREYAVTYRQLHCAVALAAVTGHVFPPWLWFRGGKGVATALGVVAAMEWKAALAALVVYAALLRLTNKGSVASLSAAVAAALGMYAFRGLGAYLYLVCGLVLFILATHRENLMRLWKRRELDALPPTP